MKQLVTACITALMSVAFLVDDSRRVPKFKNRE
jgi:hypothetical protein